MHAYFIRAKWLLGCVPLAVNTAAAATSHIFRVDEWNLQTRDTNVVLCRRRRRRREHFKFGQRRRKRSWSAACVRFLVLPKGPSLLYWYMAGSKLSLRLLLLLLLPLVAVPRRRRYNTV